ncbi:MAG TPA: DNA polymerase Y family protein, partial [Kiloniellales bacterium]|nr:DNA polymerase Y family protein [Kiloniellales bacterium]
LPPASLAPRFGPLVARRLAQALGAEAEPIAPLRPVAPHRVRHVFAEPVVTTEPLAAALAARLAELCRGLERAQCGARRLTLELYRVDGTLRRLSLGVSRPSRDPAHLERLFAEHLERIDPGFGLEVLVLAAPEVEPLNARQLSLGTGASAGGDPAEGALAALVDRLSSRLGPAAVRRLVPRESRLPERAVAMPAMLEDSGPEAPAPTKETAWRPPATPPRPARLLPRPEPIEAVALLPDDPPALFRWRRLRHRVTRAEGPERLSPEWWREAPGSESLSGPFRAASRDYYRVEVEDGRRYWLYRAAGGWYLHGLFG